jgi:hypothetical protein
VRLLFLWSLAWALGSCGLSCTQMSAPSQVTLQFEGMVWTPGRYELEVNGYNQFGMCVVDLPASGVEPSCTNNATLELDPTGEHVVSFLVRDFDPGNFGLEVLRDGEEVLSEQFVPDYEVDEPNGPGCGKRSQAMLTVRG